MLLLAPSVPAHAASVPYVGSVPVTAGASGEGAGPAGTILAHRSVPFLLLDARFDAQYDLVLQNFVTRSAETGTLPT